MAVQSKGTGVLGVSYNWGPFLDVQRLKVPRFAGNANRTARHAIRERQVLVPQSGDPVSGDFFRRFLGVDWGSKAKAFRFRFFLTLLRRNMLENLI